MLPDLAAQFSSRVFVRVYVHIGATRLDELDQLRERFILHASNQVLLGKYSRGQHSAELAFFLGTGKEAGKRRTIFPFFTQMDMGRGDVLDISDSQFIG